MGFGLAADCDRPHGFRSQPGSNAARLWLFIAREPPRRLSGCLGYNTLAAPRRRGLATFKSNANQAAASRVIFNRTKFNKRSHVARPRLLITFSDCSGVNYLINSSSLTEMTDIDLALCLLPPAGSRPTPGCDINTLRGYLMLQGTHCHRICHSDKNMEETELIWIISWLIQFINSKLISAVHFQQISNYKFPTQW